MAIPTSTGPTAADDYSDTYSIDSAVPPHPLVPASAFVPGHAAAPSTASTASVDVEAWTVSALAALAVSPIARGTGSPLTIPLDEARRADAAPRMRLRGVCIADDATVGVGASVAPPRRRDSTKRREELQRGNEGSRQRRRWENDRLVHVPNVQPPLPTDFEHRPVYPVTHVPYALAQFWDTGLRERAEQRRADFAAHRKQAAHLVVNVAAQREARARAEVGKVPRELRATAKKTPAVKLWLRGLEEPVRQFLVDQGVVETPAAEVSSDDLDSDDEEIVFVARNGTMRDGAKAWKKARREVPNKPAQAGMVLDSLGDDESAAFKRWLTHSISDYYGLDSRSATVGTPARRVVYVGVKHVGPEPVPLFSQLPTPLWELFA